MSVGTWVMKLMKQFWNFNKLFQPCSINYDTKDTDNINTMEFCKIIKCLNIFL